MGFRCSNSGRIFLQGKGKQSCCIRLHGTNTLPPSPTLDILPKKCYYKQKHKRLHIPAPANVQRRIP